MPLLWEHAMKTLYTVLLLVLSNVFMTIAWYGHLKFASMKWFQSLPLIGIILISWGIAFAEYCFQVPANRIGWRDRKQRCCRSMCCREST